MARRTQWVFFLVIFLAISTCLATSSKSLKTKKSIKSNKKTDPSIPTNLKFKSTAKKESDFIFTDDEDRLSEMLGDQAIESSCDGSPGVAPETDGDGSPDVAPETDSNPGEETPEDIVVTSKPVTKSPTITKTPQRPPHRPPHRPPLANASLPDYIPTEV